MTWLAVKTFFKKIKDVVVEYWQAFVALFLVVLGYVLGTKGNTSKIDRSDKQAIKDHGDRMITGQKDLYEKRIKDIEDATNEHESRVAKIKEKTESELKELSNDSKKLDKILKEKYNLKKGE